MSKSQEHIFYVYVYLDPRKPGNYVYGEYIFDYEPFYVGKGSNGRAYTHLSYNKDNDYFNNKIKKIQRICGCDPHVTLYKESLDEKLAFDLEISMISVIGRYNLKRGPLLNLTDGGDGSSGCVRNMKTKQKMSKSKIGIKRPDDVRRKISESHKGKKVSNETKKKMSETNKGQIPWNKGKVGYKLPKMTEETKRKISESKKGQIPWNKRNCKK